MYSVSVDSHFENVVVATFLVDVAMNIPIFRNFSERFKDRFLGLFQTSKMELFCTNS